MKFKKRNATNVNGRIQQLKGESFASGQMLSHDYKAPDLTDVSAHRKAVSVTGRTKQNRKE